MKTKIFTTLALMVAICSCGKYPEGNNSSLEKYSDVPIIFKAAASGGSKGITAVTTENLDTIYVAAASGTAGTSDTYPWSAQHTFAKSGSAFVPKEGDSYWPITDPKYHFYASNASMSISEGKAPTISAKNTSDIVCAYLANPTFQQANELKFQHIFARLDTIYYKAPSKWKLTSLTVSFKAGIEGTYDIYSGNGKQEGEGWSNISTEPNEWEASKSLKPNEEGFVLANDYYLVPGKYIFSFAYKLTLNDDPNVVVEKTIESTDPKITIYGGSINILSLEFANPNEHTPIKFNVTVVDWGKERTHIDL